MELSEKQIEILQLVANGKSNKTIASLMWHAPSTIKYHKRRIKKILCTQNMTHSVAVAWRLGLIR